MTFDSLYFFILNIYGLHVLILAPTTRGIYLREASACRQLSEVWSLTFCIAFKK